MVVDAGSPVDGMPAIPPLAHGADARHNWWMATLTSARASDIDVPPGDDRRPRGAVLVWYEGTADGRAALEQAHELAATRGANLTVLTIAAHERVIGCGRCLQGTVLWNIEMEKIAADELTEARRILDGVTAVTYQLAVGDPAELISETATRSGAQAIMIPRQRNRRLDPPHRRHIARKLAARGPWQVISAEAAQPAAIRARRAAGRPPRS